MKPWLKKVYCILRQGVICTNGIKLFDFSRVIVLSYGRKIKLQAMKIICTVRYMFSEGRIIQMLYPCWRNWPLCLSEGLWFSSCPPQFCHVPSQGWDHLGQTECLCLFWSHSDVNYSNQLTFSLCKIRLCISTTNLSMWLLGVENDLMARNQSINLQLQILSICRMLRAIMFEKFAF